jgi:hypothetical protein
VQSKQCMRVDMVNFSTKTICYTRRARACSQTMLLNRKTLLYAVTGLRVSIFIFERRYTTLFFYIRYIIYHCEINKWRKLMLTITIIDRRRRQEKK